MYVEYWKKICLVLAFANSTMKYDRIIGSLNVHKLFICINTPYAVHKYMCSRTVGVMLMV